MKTVTIVSTFLDENIVYILVYRQSKQKPFVIITETSCMIKCKSSPWYLYKMVTQNILRTHEQKKIFYFISV